MIVVGALTHEIVLKKFVEAMLLGGKRKILRSNMLRKLWTKYNIDYDETIRNELKSKKFPKERLGELLIDILKFINDCY